MILYAVLSDSRDFVAWPENSDYPTKPPTAYLFLGFFNPANAKSPFLNMAIAMDKVTPQYYIYVEERDKDFVLSFPSGNNFVALVSDGAKAKDQHARVLSFCSLLHDQVLMAFNIPMFTRVADQESDMLKFGEIRQRAKMQVIHKRQLDQFLDRC